jgi:hypothetical protein
LLTMPVVVGFGVYAVGAPIVHLAEGEPWRAAGSLGLRLALPLAIGGSALLISNHEDCSQQRDESCGWGALRAAVAGGAVGMALAITLDAAVLAYRTAPTQPSKPAAFRYSPNLSMGRDSVMISASGMW